MQNQKPDPQAFQLYKQTLFGERLKDGLFCYPCSQPWYDGCSSHFICYSLMIVVMLRPIGLWSEGIWKSTLLVEQLNVGRLDAGHKP